jgi:prepilin-type N-terminal cleavage/methylation domain-containing protein
VLIDLKRAGFTLVEICVALVILAIAVLGIAASAGQLASLSASAESRAVALQAVIQLSQNYGALDSVFTSTESNNPEPGLTRATDIVRTRTAMPGGQFLDYTTITVIVSGPRVTPAISRSLVVGAP